MKTRYILFFLALSCLSAHAQFYRTQQPFAHTYSIVARDANTGEMAVAVQSHWFSVGSDVSWARAGVGVVATQSFIDPSYGHKGLALLEQGKTPQQVLDQLLAEDPGREVRQVAILDSRGRTAVHTGKNCIQYAGHINKTNYSVQANMMLNSSVWPAMARTFEELDSLPLAERVLAAMNAAEAQGGDIRGKQSAVLVVVKGAASQQPWRDELINLQVADHPDPLGELQRLLQLHRAYELMNQGDVAMEENDMSKAVMLYGEAQKLSPENQEMKYWHAITLANNGSFDEAKVILEEVFTNEPQWKLLTQRLPEVGLLSISEDQLRELLALP